MKKEDIAQYFDDICGYDYEKQELMYLCDIMRNPEPYKALGARIPRNVLLSGEPGVGKTLMSECLIKASGRKAFRVSKNEDDENFVGTLLETFRKARDEAPSIVFLDDMDKYSGGYFGQSTEEATVQACIDDMRDEEVFVIAAVNEKRGISRSLIRAGRFDRNLHVNIPDRDSARQIIRRYFSETKEISDDIDIETIVDITSGMTAVDIRTLANEAGVFAGFDRSDAITLDHIVKAYVSRMDNDRSDNHIDDDERSKVTACHEAGHAAVAELLEPGSVGLVFAGRQAGRSEGFMSTAKSDARVGCNQYRTIILTALGGRAATELVFGMPDRGAGCDISRAIIAIRKELTCLCTDGLGMAVCRQGEYEISNEHRNRLDRICREKLKVYYSEVKSLLENNRGFLDMMAGALEEKGYLIAEDICSLRRASGM